MPSRHFLDFPSDELGHTKTAIALSRALCGIGAAEVPGSEGLQVLDFEERSGGAVRVVLMQRIDAFAIYRTHQRRPSVMLLLDEMPIRSARRARLA
jgi:hypothetical protein